MDLVDLSVYWNYGSANEYLMHPVNANIEISKDKNPTPLTGSDPRFKVNFNIGDVVFQLSDKQHHIIYSIVEKLDWFYKRQRFKAGRPLRSISEVCDNESTTSEEKHQNIKKWWAWVINHHYQPIQRYHARNTPAYVSQRCRDIVTYSNIIRSILKKDVLTDEQKETKLRIEKEWEYEECKLVIYAAIDLEFKPASDDTNLREGWGSWMMRGGGLFRARTSSLEQTSNAKIETQNLEQQIPAIDENVTAQNLTLKTSTTNRKKHILKTKEYVNMQVFLWFS